MQEVTEQDINSRNTLALQHKGLVTSIAKNFIGRGEELADLTQIGMIGLLSAIERYDPEISTLSTYGTPYIIGEIRKHFRKDGQMIHIPAGISDFMNRVKKESYKFYALKGREPQLKELAEILHVTEERIIEIFAIQSVADVSSLEVLIETEKSFSILDIIGEDDPQMTEFLDQSILDGIKHLPNERMKKIVYLEFYQGLSQKEISKILGISQMHVSRLRTKALNKLKVILADYK